MTLKKAIEILTQLSVPGSPDLNPDDFDALKLGIEAITRVKLHRTDRRYPFNTLLPGETEE